MSDRHEPELAPPGAGLPGIELLLVRSLFAVRRWTGDRRSFDARFSRERDRIRAMVGRCDADSGSRRVLIRRTPGLEDNSRYWSVWMALDHLRLVHTECVRVLTALTRGAAPEGSTSIAAVKPSPRADASTVAAFEASCDAVRAVVAASPDLHTRNRHPHPWLGRLNAAGWHAFAGEHMGIHRVQIERILAGLPTSKNVGR